MAILISRWKNNFSLYLFILFIICFLFGCSSVLSHPEQTIFNSKTPLPSWSEGKSKEIIIQYINKISAPESASYVSPENRIATFDCDGTLWVEKPEHVEIGYEFKSIYEKAKRNPLLRSVQPYKSVYENDLDYLYGLGQENMARLLFNTHEGMRDTDYINEVKDYLSKTLHPRLKMPLKDLAYLPMVELIKYLQKNIFKVYVVSGSEISFIRAISQETFNIQTENVIGSFPQFNYESVGGKKKIVRGETDNINFGSRKPANIYLFIGKKPIFAFGNSDGDIDMLNYANSNKKASLCLLLKHDDSKREYAYDKSSKKALGIAMKEGWTTTQLERF